MGTLLAGLLGVAASVGFVIAWRGRHRRAAAAGLVVAAVSLAAATVAVPGTVTARYGGEGCTPGCTVVAGGWPLPWLADNPGLSPANSVFLMGAVLGIDRVRPWAFLADAALFGALLLGVGALSRRTREDDAPAP